MLHGPGFCMALPVGLQMRRKKAEEMQNRQSKESVSWTHGRDSGGRRKQKPCPVSDRCSVIHDTFEPWRCDRFLAVALGKPLIVYVHLFPAPPPPTPPRNRFNVLMFMWSKLNERSLKSSSRYATATLFDDFDISSSKTCFHLSLFGFCLIR